MNGAGAGESSAESPEPMAEDAAPALDSVADLAQEAQPMEPEVEAADSETQADYQLSFSLGGDPEAVNDFPTFGQAADTENLEGLGITLETNHPQADDSLASTTGDYNADPGSVSQALPGVSEPILSVDEPMFGAAEPNHHEMADDSSLMTTDTGRHEDESTSALAAEDSFLEGDHNNAAQTLTGSPARAHNPFGTDGEEAPNTTWHNPVWDMSASPDPASRAPSPFIKSGFGPARSPGEVSTSQVRYLPGSLVSIHCSGSSHVLTWE